VAAPAGAQHRAATVRCVRGICATHFEVEINGSETTTWKMPFQRAGAANCFEVPYISGRGTQRTQFAGSGVVEATTGARGSTSFEYLRGGEARPGIGEGHATVTRTAQLVTHVTPGPCGANKSVGDHDSARNCGSHSYRWIFDASAGDDQIAIDGDTPVAILVAPFEGCPLLETGTPNADIPNLNSFTAALPRSELFDHNLGKIIVFGSHTFSDTPPNRGNVTGRTQIKWTLTLTRIPHRVFPLPAPPLTPIVR
jgi:hypothetical protein